MGAQDKPEPSARIRRRAGGEALAERLVRRGLLGAREVLRKRRARTQKIVAWNPANAESLANAAEETVRDLLTTTRGPLPLALLMEKAKVTRAVVMRLEKSGRLLTWEEPLTQEDDAWDADFTPPANMLNAEQKQALE